MMIAKMLPYVQSVLYNDNDYHYFQVLFVINGEMVQFWLNVQFVHSLILTLLI